MRKKLAAMVHEDFIVYPYNSLAFMNSDSLQDVACSDQPGP
jgi:hypothetical protein